MLTCGMHAQDTCAHALLQRVHVGWVAFVCFSKGCDPASLRTTGTDSTSNGQESIRLSEGSRLVPFAFTSEEGKQGHIRPTEASQK